MGGVHPELLAPLRRRAGAVVHCATRRNPAFDGSLLPWTRRHEPGRRARKESGVRRLFRSLQRLRPRPHGRQRRPGGRRGAGRRRCRDRSRRGHGAGDGRRDERQPQGHAQIVINMIDFGMNLQEAGDAPRIRHGGSSQPTGEIMNDGGTLYLESGIDYEVIRELMKKGHKITFDVGGYGGYQAIMYDAENGVYFGASESRKDGQAAGF